MKNLIIILTIILTASCVTNSKSCKKAHKAKAKFNQIQYR